MEGLVFGTFPAEPLAGASPVEARPSTTSPLTAQASARVNQPGTASVDEVMGDSPLADPVITGADSHNTSSGSTVPGLAETTDRVDRNAAGYSLNGIVPPRATTAELNHRYVEGCTEPVATERARNVTFGQTTQHGTDLTEQERLRRLIAEATIDLNALTTGDRRPSGDNSTVRESMIDTLLARAPGNGSGGGSILLNGLRERQAQRTEPQVPIPTYPHVERERPLNMAVICAMAKDQKYTGTVQGERSPKQRQRFEAFKYNVARAVRQFKFPDSNIVRLENFCTLMHLEGEAKDIVVEWSTQNGEEASMAKIFSILSNQCKLVELDGMDIAAEVEVKVSIQPLMRVHNSLLHMTSSAWPPPPRQFFPR
jgi:hypothetical protein